MAVCEARSTEASSPSDLSHDFRPPSSGGGSDLDGKAVVFKNPGNAEDTWNGLDRIDEWLDLERYLLNGQEYLELVDGVKKVMGDEAECLRDNEQQIWSLYFIPTTPNLTC